MFPILKDYLGIPFLAQFSFFVCVRLSLGEMIEIYQALCLPTGGNVGNIGSDIIIQQTGHWVEERRGSSENLSIF